RWGRKSMTAEPVSVILVDDHDLVRQGLRRAFERDERFTIVGVAGSADDAHDLATSVRPDIAVIDIRLSDGNGLDVVKTLRADRRDVGIVVVTMYDDDEHLFAA